MSVILASRNPSRSKISFAALTRRARVASRGASAAHSAWSRSLRRRSALAHAPRFALDFHRTVRRTACAGVSTTARPARVPVQQRASRHAPGIRGIARPVGGPHRAVRRAGWARSRPAWRRAGSRCRRPTRIGGALQPCIVRACRWRRWPSTLPGGAWRGTRARWSSPSRRSPAEVLDELVGAEALEHGRIPAVDLHEQVAVALQVRRQSTDRLLQALRFVDVVADGGEHRPHPDARGIAAGLLGTASGGGDRVGHRLVAEERVEHDRRPCTARRARSSSRPMPPASAECPRRSPHLDGGTGSCRLVRRGRGSSPPSRAGAECRPCPRAVRS